MARHIIEKSEILALHRLRYCHCAGHHPADSSCATKTYCDCYCTRQRRQQVCTRPQLLSHLHISCGHSLTKFFSLFLELLVQFIRRFSFQYSRGSSKLQWHCLQLLLVYIWHRLDSPWIKCSDWARIQIVSVLTLPEIIRWALDGGHCEVLKAFSLKIHLNGFTKKALYELDFLQY